MMTCLQTKNRERGPRELRHSLKRQKNERQSRQIRCKKQQSNKAVRFNILLSDYIRCWLTHVQRKVDAVTYQGYELLATDHLLPYFDATAIQLCDVTTADLQMYMDEKQAHGRKDGRGGLSARSLRLHKNILHQAMEEAIKTGLLTTNPCRNLILPQAQRYFSHYYTAEQLQQFFTAIQNEPLFPLLKIAALYGLRRSELLGLKWDSLDFHSGMLTIRHTVSKVTKVVEKDKTKNASSFRSFPLTPDAITIFILAREQEKAFQRSFGKAYQKNEYVFKWPDGHPYLPDYISKKFSALLKKYGFPHIRFHELRHSCASMLINSGFNLKDIQEWMGHSDIKMTANIYGHLDFSRKQNMADKLSDTLLVETKKK